MQAMFADTVVSVSELKRNPTQVVENGGAAAVAVLNHNRVMAYMVPAALWERTLERLDDMELADIAQRRLHECGVEVRLDEL